MDAALSLNLRGLFWRHAHLEGKVRQVFEHLNAGRGKLRRPAILHRAAELHDVVTRLTRLIAVDGERLCARKRCV